MLRAELRLAVRVDQAAHAIVRVTIAALGQTPLETNDGWDEVEVNQYLEGAFSQWQARIVWPCGCTGLGEDKTQLLRQPGDTVFYQQTLDFGL